MSCVGPVRRRDSPIKDGSRPCVIASGHSSRCAAEGAAEQCRGLPCAAVPLLFLLALTLGELCRTADRTAALASSAAEVLFVGGRQSGLLTASVEVSCAAAAQKLLIKTNWHLWTVNV